MKMLEQGTMEKCVGPDDGENLFPVKEEAIPFDLSVKEEMDSIPMAEEQESHPDAALSGNLHVTIQNGGPIPLEQCMQCCNKYHCPFCKPEIFKPTVKSKASKHVKSHEKRAVKYREYVIYKCGLYCQVEPHFHCLKCTKLVERRNRFLEHLVKCVGPNDREDLYPLQDEAIPFDLSVKEEMDSIDIAEEQESHPDAVLSENGEAIPFNLSVKDEIGSNHMVGERESRQAAVFSKNGEAIPFNLSIKGEMESNHMTEERESLPAAVLNQEEVDPFNLSVKDEMGSNHMARERESHPAAVFSKNDEADPINLSVRDETESNHMEAGQEVRSPPVLRRKLHVTIQNGGPIHLAKCVQCCSKYHCPFCKPEVFKPTFKSKVRKHIKAHEKRAVKSEGYIIFRCGLNCRPVSHFHCPKCCRVVLKKNRFVEHLSKCMGTWTGDDGGYYLPGQHDPVYHHMFEEEENIPVSESMTNYKLSFTNPDDSASPSKRKISECIPYDDVPTPVSTCSEMEEKPWHEAVRSLQTSQETSIFKSSEVLVNTQCLLELFQFCWLCQDECSVSIKGNGRMFAVSQDCQSCGYHRDWRSHPLSAEPIQTFHNEEEHRLEEEVVVQITSSDNECSEKVFIQKDGSYLFRDDEEASREEVEEEAEEEVTRKRKRMSESEASSDEWEQWLNEEDTDSDSDSDEDPLTVLKGAGRGKVLVWCTQCETEALRSCSLLQHDKLFCCAECGPGDISNFEKLPVRFDDVISFQIHAEQEHGVKPSFILCQECGKLVRAQKEHVCEHKI